MFAPGNVRVNNCSIGPFGQPMPSCLLFALLTVVYDAVCFIDRPVEYVERRCSPASLVPGSGEVEPIPKSGADPSRVDVELQLLWADVVLRRRNVVAWFPARLEMRCSS